MNEIETKKKTNNPRKRKCALIENESDDDDDYENKCESELEFVAPSKKRPNLK